MLNTILEVIQQKTGTVLKDSRLERTQHLLQSWIQDGTSPQEILNHLNTAPMDDPVWQQIVARVTVGETYFFRNQGHFSALQSFVFPKLIEERRRANQRYLRVWIAGCATGEEAYSVAILLRDLLPDIDEWSVFILATDINAGFLAQARAGVYRERAFRKETPAHIQARWFTPTAEGYELKPQIRKMVTFGALNLTEESYPSLSNNTTGLDLILCRNVTIYFDRPTTQRIVSRFYNALAKEGWLIVGHSEPQPVVYDAFGVHNVYGTILYSKTPTPRASTAMIGNPPPSATPITPTTPPMPMPIDALPVSKLPPPPPAPQPTLSADAQLEQAYLAADREDWQTALSILAGLERTQPFNPTLHYLRGVIFSQQDQLANAINAMQRATYCDPQFALAHYALGELLLRNQKRDEAQASWRRAQKALRNLPNDALVQGTFDLTVEMLNDLLRFRLG